MWPAYSNCCLLQAHDQGTNKEPWKFNIVVLVHSCLGRFLQSPQTKQTISSHIVAVVMLFSASLTETRIAITKLVETGLLLLW